MSTNIYSPIQNKYYKWYCNIITKAKLRNDGDEKHHIIPKSLGGENNKENIVSLTHKEHLICHWLLIYCYANKAKAKMVYALNRMCNKNKNTIYYEIARKLHSQNVSGVNNPRYGGNGCQGYKHTIEYRTYISKRMQGKNHPMFGKQHTEEAKEKIKQKLASNKEHKEKMRLINCRSWYFITPDKNKITIFNLTQYCKDNSLSYNSMTHLHYGYLKNYKGWTKDASLNI